MRLNEISEVVNSNLCIGCGICTTFSKNANIEYNNDGFLVVNNYEHNNLLLSEKEVVRNICPGVKTYKDININDSIWGRVKSINLGYSTNEKIRFMGSSGGTITETLIYLIENKIVDYIIHIEKDEKNPLSNKVVITNDVNEIINNTGSKYCPSSPLNNVINNLEKSKKYAFVGRPCDIVAISNYQRYDKNLENVILYKIAFFCAGTPSIKGTENILEKFKIDKRNLKEFRYRGNGWPGYTTALNNDNEEFKMPYEESWGTILNKYLSLRCKICPDGIGMEADIVYGDGWDCDEKGYPVFTEGEGQSIIITRTDKGQKLLNEMYKNNKLEIKDFNISNLKYIQPYQFTRRTTLIYRVIAMKIFGKNVPSYEKGIYIASKNQSIKIKIKTFLGTVKRILNNRI